MHTQEQAKQLWCPMARVAQVGATETHAAYNRALQKTHMPVKVADHTPENFELGKEPETKTAIILQVKMELSGAAMCVGNNCAMWRNGPTPEKRVRQCPNPKATTEDDAGANQAQSGEWTFTPYDESELANACWLETDSSIDARRMGYCGLVGLPGARS